MENKHHHIGEDIDPVSRKTNEEIDSDDEGNLLIGGRETDQQQSVASDGPVSEDLPKGQNSLDTEDQS